MSRGWGKTSFGRLPRSCRARSGPGLCLAFAAGPLPVNRCLTRGAGAGRRVTAGHHRPREAGTAARRRLASPGGLPPKRARLLPTPQRGPSPVIPLWGRRPGGHRLAGYLAPEPPASGKFRANGAADLTRGGGPYAVWRSGCLRPARPSPMRAAARVPLSSPLRPCRRPGARQRALDDCEENPHSYVSAGTA